MSLDPNAQSAIQKLVTDTAKFAKVYDWNSAVSLCEEYIKNNGEDPKATELLADYFYNLAFQERSRESFKNAILRARQTYERATENNRCRTRAAFCKYWASDDPVERGNILNDECLPPARNASSNATEIRLHREILEYLYAACDIASEGSLLLNLVNEAKRRGKDAFDQFCLSSEKIEPDSIGLCLEYVRFLAWAQGNFISSEFLKQILKVVVPVVHRLAKVADTLEDDRIASLAHEAAAMSATEFEGNALEGTLQIEKSISFVEKTNDFYLTGRQLAYFSYSLRWARINTDVPETRTEYLEKQLRCASKALEYLEVFIPGVDLETCFDSSCDSLVELSKDLKGAEKEKMLDRAIENGRSGVRYAVFSPTQSYVEVRLTDALRARAKLFDDRLKREKIRSESISIFQVYMKRLESLIEPHAWNMGVFYGYLGAAKAELAEDKEKKEDKEKLLREASLDLAKGIEIIQAAFESQAKSQRPRIGGICEELGNTFLKMFEISCGTDDARSAISYLEQAAFQYSSANLCAFVAPLEWKIARIYDTISEYENSSKSFLAASEQYELAAKNQKSLQRSFNDLSLYLQAWSKIETARSLHRDEEYTLASVSLKESSELLQQTENFAYLSAHYLGQSKAEEAEEFSRKERSQEASAAFLEASKHFVQAEKDVLEYSGRSSDDSFDTKNWAKLSSERARYCLARKELEEIRVLDKSAQPQITMRKYRLAADSLRKIEEETDQAKNELEALALSCEAFATMKEAEQKSSPQLFAKAAELFHRSKENNEKTSFIQSCLANAAMCEALSTGTAFKRSNDVALYSEIKSKLGVASRYYEEAGFEIASEWTRATEALFDALAYLAGAEREIDPQKKTQMYHLAEKHLELSARRYGDIGYDRKRQEVLKHLKAARENRELLITPMEALSQSPTVSATPVNFTRDQAVGLERFEVANLTGNISLSTKSTNVGSSIRIDIDIANVGKTPALLMKLDNIAPSHIFEIEAEKNPHHFLEGASSIAVDLKGKRLEYLKAHEMSIHFIAKSKGNFEIKPKVLFVDELGKYRSYEFEPQSVEVKELGFMGWAKGK